MHGSWLGVGVRIAAGALVLGSAAACGGTVPAQAPPVAAPTSSLSAPTTTAATSAPAAAGELASVFPDTADSTCAPSDETVRTRTGVLPTEASTCDYSAVAAGAQVVFAQWPDQEAAQAWYQETADLGPRVETNDQWQVGGVTQGPLYTAQNSNGVVISTGVYEDLPYTWEIRTGTLDESNAVFGQIRLQQSADIAG
ncbi:hypothetical protein I4I73_19885 [Pseudonocardia sp. KRD-184]|uniref:DUF3558 domain-containing protein n=1 Tax=Pseudonocardia oceani TaxID=2792013 RepID=A0ABS6UBS7_9PSEU|nr:hypothetical protein [Pseudonocardia oceani]MBW0091766.1 hypothetical protein [Pseudonocardia oceani]MBW0098249.1 hypothetical protein [Pseudonocardia oceani]MBW0111633.1 hypothetical protein [Pseudonocardia oceani]MBW0124848.1 hypothetical protein [Pseudonocardia oceani]MBW0129693.1 hypothetical protein [Pseudonocardia oceani]